MSWPHFAHAVRQTLLFEPFYTDILYRFNFLALSQTVLLCLLISVERVGFLALAFMYIDKVVVDQQQ